VIESNIGCIVAWLKDHHFLLPEQAYLTLDVVTCGTSGIGFLSGALTPEVGMVLVVQTGAVALEVRDHSLPSIVLGCHENVIVVLVEAICQVLEEDGVIDRALAIEVDFHVVEGLLQLTGGSSGI
jgi:hypothetical protein